MRSATSIFLLAASTLLSPAWVDAQSSQPPDLQKLIDNGHCKGCKLAGADLSGMRLMSADLSGANLRGARLRKTILFRADLSSADLRDAKVERRAWAGSICPMPI
ncbi:MAG: pentapeptide repeat-containing protein [Gammaproteobacteria bacterium]|nr:pentapeptide repeat-containing protein [Gammaproteobacteria bacterium]